MTLSIRSARAEDIPLIAQFIRDLAARGYDDVPARKLVEMRIHGIDAEFLDRVSSRSESD